MNIQYFNSFFMPALNHRWAAMVLNMEENPKRGPDLIAEDKVVELKFAARYPGKHPSSWKTLEHQLKYGQNKKPAFWGVGFYDLRKIIKLLTRRDARIMEALVTQRELYLIEWDWMNQFVSHEERGKGITGEYNNTIRFSSKQYLPQTNLSVPVEKGYVHFTKGVDPSLFNINKRRH